MTIPDELIRLRDEARELRQRTATSERSAEQLREKSDRLGREVGEKKKNIKQLEEENKQLKDENDQLKAQLATLGAHDSKLSSIVFKASTAPHGEGQHTDGQAQTSDKKKRGGQMGHAGHARSNPTRIDREVDVCLTHCPDCKNQLTPSNTSYTRIVEDIPEPTTVVTKYTIARQWCTHCKKEVYAIPEETLPDVRYGRRTITLILLLKYRLRTPLQKITEFLETHHGLHITKGGIQSLLHALKEKFNNKYNELLKEIRASPVKHADETGWRVQGQNWWCWLFASAESVVYTIRDTRGKSVPTKMLDASNPHGVLVRDDYAGYKKLPMAQQSCWSHLLRVSREACEQPSATEESPALHKELGMLFGELSDIIKHPFHVRERRHLHAIYAKRIQEIIERTYVSLFARKVQTRIKNQGNNLITALLYHDVPLTNNFAERQIRPLAVTRKISGGSQSQKGSETHAVNMSIVQSIALQGKAFSTEIHKLLSVPAQRLALERGE